MRQTPVRPVRTGRTTTTSPARARLRPGLRDENGLALVDVLIGVALFGLVMLIALTAAHQYRIRAYESAALSDARQIGDGLMGGMRAQDETVTAASPDTSPAMVTSAVSAPAMAVSRSAGPVAHSSSTAPRVYNSYAAITDPVREAGGNLTRGNRIANWKAFGEDHFGFCIEHVTNGRVDAFAAYRSDKGGIYSFGRYDGCPEIDADAAVVPPEDEPTPDVPTTPTTPTTPTVPAVPPLPPVPSVPPVPDVPVNDECVGSIEVPQPSTNFGISLSSNVSNVGATEDSSVWFRTWSPLSMYSTLSLESTTGADLGGDFTLRIYKAPRPGPKDPVCPTDLVPVGQTTSRHPGLSFLSEVNQNYYVKVTSTVSAQSAFKVRLGVSGLPVLGDAFSNAEPLSALPGVTLSLNVPLSTNQFATTEPGEENGGGLGSVWYRVVNLASLGTPTYTFSTKGTGSTPIGRHTIEVYRGATSASSRGTLVTSASGVGAAAVTFDAPPAAGPFWVRIVGDSGREGGAYSVTLTRGAK